MQPNSSQHMHVEAVRQLMQLMSNISTACTRTEVHAAGQYFHMHTHPVQLQVVAPPASWHGLHCMCGVLMLFAGLLLCLCAGYWAEDWTQIEPRYGTEQDLKDLIAAAHKKGRPNEASFTTCGRCALMTRETTVKDNS